jgi:hypothetical protein
VLLFQFPAVTMPANAPHGALRESAAVSAPAPSTQPSPRTSAIAPTNALDDSAAPAQPRTSSIAASEASNQPVQPSVQALLALTGPSFSESILLPPPAFRPPNELPVSHHRLWFALTTAEHSAAGYDAWSTRYALSNGRVEADPLMRPFAGSAAIYPAIQLIPFGLDFLAHRLERSSGWTHHVWWVPQSLATVTFLFSGSYNIVHTN